MLTGGLVNVEFSCCVHFVPGITWNIMSMIPAVNIFFSVKFISRNEHSSLTSWIIIGVPLAGLLKRSENLGINRIIRSFVTFLFISVVVSAEYSMFADSRRGVIVIKAFFSTAR